MIKVENLTKRYAGQTAIQDLNFEVTPGEIMQDQAALDFVSGAVNWLLSREQMIGIAPKIPKPLTFSLDPEGLSRLRWILLVLMPLIPAVIGTVVWWQRRV